MRKKLFIIIPALIISFGLMTFAPQAHAQVKGALGGAAAGAAIGSVVPGVGTVVGGVVGGILGGLSGSVTNTLIGGITIEVINSVLAIISTILLHIMVIWIALTGALLNVSITMTLHIKDFVDNTQGVYLVWQTIRDITGIFIIFMLLFASFKIILGFDAVGSVGTLIKNIVIVGVLINFSFFITSLLIDASNVVSLALYNGIVNQSTAANPLASNCPTNTAAGAVTSYNTCAIVSQMYTGTQGGLSAIFMNALNPQLIYNDAGGVGSANSSVNTSSTTNSTATGDPFKIIIQSIVGIIIMFTSGLSFLLASLAFMVRLIVLVILLAFSPIWFASWVIPGLKDEAGKFTKQLKSQLVFMPVYLLLLYAALRVLSSSTVFTNPSTDATANGAFAGLSFIPVNYIILAINDFFIIFLINMPLVVGLTMGGLATDWIDTKKFGAQGIWKNVGASVGRNTGGRLAHIASNSAANKWLTSRVPFVGNPLSKQLDKAANYGFGQKKGGFKDVQDANQKTYEAQYKKLHDIDESRYDDTIKDSAGKTALMRAKEVAEKNAAKYYDNTKDTILSKMMQSAATKAGAALEGPTQAMQNLTKGLSIVVGEHNKVAGAAINAVSENIGGAAGALASAPGTLAMNLAGRKAAGVIKKQKDAEVKEKAGDEASKRIRELQDNYDSWDSSVSKEQLERKHQVDNLTTAIQEFEESVGNLRKEIEPTQNVNKARVTMGLTSTTAIQEASLKEKMGKLEEMKQQKIETEKKIRAVSHEKEIKANDLRTEKQKLQKTVSAGSAIKEDKFKKELLSEVKKAAQEGKESGDKGGESKPKPDAPKE